ncbi:hypothetical protein COLO4_07221 [Corchorus olitorius]|uniref:F-box domain-containing protein n=1 Tax=Corchorus olitorius TaxID=93759 RepID=A0A1R3KKQ4_9ROSI|nr:hypothetical protein COLO4_07221 [Corchorus olitorius]
MSKLLKPMDGSENLPPECWQFIFSHLNEGDLKRVSLACKSFLANADLVKESLNVFHPKFSILSQHLKRFTQLKSLHLSKYFQGDLNEALSEVAGSDISLEALHIASGITAPFKTECLRELGSNPKMKHLKALSFNWTSCSPNNDLPVRANSFPNLEQLIIHNHYHPLFDKGNFPQKSIKAR